MSPSFLIAGTGLLLAMAAISTDSLLPALPWLASDLGLDVSLVQQVVPAFMFGYGFGQLSFGPISDRIGRRPALAIGMAVYLFGTLICLWVDSFIFLIAGRMIQGIGAGAGQTVARAMMRDCYSGAALARNMAMATAFFAVGPILAPIVGAWLAEAGDWRSVFFGMAGFAFVMLALIWKLEESLIRPDPRALDLVRLLRNAVRVTIDPQSRYFLLLAGFSFSGIVMMLASMPRLFGENFGVEGRDFAYLFALGGFGIVIGQFINRSVIDRFGTVFSIGAGSILVAGSSGLAIILDISGQLNAASLVAVMFAFNLGYLSIYSNAITLVIDPHGDIAGFAASLAGLSASLIGSTLASLVITFIGASPWRWGLSELLVAIVVFAAVIYHQKRKYPADS